MIQDIKGQKILGYSLGECIGSGGMASVWLGKHTALDKVVAIKVLDPLLARDETLVGRFIDEAFIQNKLVHENIVSVENVSADDLAIVMEFVEGKSLDEVIEKEMGPVPLERALPWMRQILSALQCAHEQGVIHRDIKPSNVLLTEDGSVKVMDFGIAKLVGNSRLTRTNTSMGTAIYMSPEQIKGAKNVDARSDVYSLGVTFYEMLSGRAPFEGQKGDDGDSDYMIKHAHVDQVPPNPQEFYPAITDAMVAFLMKALEKAPDSRYQTVAEMLNALEAAASGSGEILYQPPAASSPEPAPAPAPPVVQPYQGSASTVIEESSTPFISSTPPTVVEDVVSSNLKMPWIALGVGAGIILLIVLVLVFRGGGDRSQDARLQSRVTNIQEKELEEEPYTPAPASSPQPSPPPEPEAPVSAGEPGGCPTPDRPWVVLAMSAKVEASDAVDKANRYRDRLRRAGFGQTSVCDGREFPNFRCCYWAVVAGAFANRANAVDLMKSLRAAGFNAYAKNAFKGKRAR